MGQYDDVIEHLAGQRFGFGTERTTLTDDEVAAVRETHPGIPEDYLSFLLEVGWGTCWDRRYRLYDQLKSPAEACGKDVELKERVLCFGDNFSGDPGGFLPDDGWKIVEVWCDSKSTFWIRGTFGSFIRDQLRMD